MKKSKQQQPAKVSQEDLADQWNDAHPPETRVVVSFDTGGETVKTQTASAAWLLGGVAMISLYGITGAYRLDRVQVLADGQPQTNQGTK